MQLSEFCDDVCESRDESCRGTLRANRGVLPPTYRKIRRGKDSAGKARQKQRDLRYQRYKNKYDHHGSANYKNVREGVLNLDIQYARCGE